jgi:hypothetical protein
MTGNRLRAMSVPLPVSSDDIAPFGTGFLELPQVILVLKSTAGFFVSLQVSQADQVNFNPIDNSMDASRKCLCKIET